MVGSLFLPTQGAAGKILSQQAVPPPPPSPPLPPRDLTESTRALRLLLCLCRDVPSPTAKCCDRIGAVGVSGKTCSVFKNTETQQRVSSGQIKMLQSLGGCAKAHERARRVGS